MIQIDGGDIVKIIAALGSLGAGGGSAFAFFKPYTEQVFRARLERTARLEREEAAIAAARLERERALERLATGQERLVGVLERTDQRIDRLEQRQDRMEAHLGVPMTSSTIPSPLPPAPAPRRALTDPDLRAVSLSQPTPAPTPQPA